MLNLVGDEGLHKRKRVIEDEGERPAKYMSIAE